MLLLVLLGSEKFMAIDVEGHKALSLCVMHPKVLLVVPGSGKSTAIDAEGHIIWPT